MKFIGLVLKSARRSKRRTALTILSVAVAVFLPAWDAVVVPVVSLPAWDAAVVAVVPFPCADATVVGLVDFPLEDPPDDERPPPAPCA